MAASFWIFCILSSVITLSLPQNVKIAHNMIPSDLVAGDQVTLKCVVTDPGDQFRMAWIRNEELVTNGSDILRDPRFYSLRNTTNAGNGKYLYVLNITSVSREDFGRWTCRYENLNGTTQSMNVILNVHYKPDSNFSACDVNLGEGILTCKAQEGNPRVGVNWYRRGRDNEEADVRRSKEFTRSGVIYSYLYISSLHPPSGDNETVDCASDVNVCSLSIFQFYDNSTLELKEEEIDDNKRQFSCTGSDVLLDAEVFFDLTNPEIVSSSSSANATRKSIVFEKSKLKPGMKVSCRLTWGHYSSKVAEVEIDFPGGSGGGAKDGGGVGNKTDYELGNPSPPFYPPYPLIFVVVAVLLIILAVIIVVMCHLLKADNDKAQSKSQGAEII